MKSMKPVEVLNDNMENLIDYLKHKLKILGTANGLSDSQISDMERDFIARLAFAAIIGDDEKEPEKSDGLPDDVINICEHNKCNNCPFNSSDRLFCRLIVPSSWEV